MNWVMQVIVFGLIAFVFFILSVDFTVLKRHMAGLIFGAAELVSGVISSFVWAYALRISGKSDWFVFGLFGYTPIALIFFAMLLVGVVCIGVNLGYWVKGRMSGKPAAQA